LEPGNPHLGKLKTSVVNGQNVSNYPGWVPGATILLPALWAPWSKPEPAPLGGSGGGGGGDVPPVTLPTATEITDLLSKYNPWGDSPGGINI
jgi:hypothetical protein